jgi:competence protein ComEC
MIILCITAIIIRQKLKFLLSKYPMRMYTALMLILFCINLVIAFTIGFTSAKCRTLLLNTQNIIPKYAHGVVESIEDVPKGTLKKPRLVRRCVLSHVKGVPQNVKIRVQGPYKKLKNISPYQVVSFDAEIFSPPTKLTLHGYDSQFDAYFNRISAFGRVKSVLSVKDETSMRSNWFQQKRVQFSEKLRANLSSSVAPLATALTTGDKSGITIQIRENFTRSGLSHILAISGLHMGLLAWLAFSVISKLLVLIPRLATRFIVKKIAAIITIPFMFLYLAISGASFSAIRAFIMVTLSMLSILVDQKPISLRNTAIAAIIILVIFPESAYAVSFQLSFASVTLLCYTYENYQCKFFCKQKVLNDENLKQENSKFYSAKKFVSHWILIPLSQSIVSTFVATFATTPIIVYVFQRMTLVGIFGNLLAIPVLSVCVMPLLVTTTILPCKITFALLERSLNVLSLIAEVVAKLPGSNYLLPRPSLISVLLIIFSTLWFIIWQERKKLISMPFFFIGWVLFFSFDPPNIFLTKNIIGTYYGDTFYISSQRFGSFHAKVWSQECCVPNVQPMSYQQLNRIKNRFAEFIPSNEKDVAFLWIKQGEQIKTKVLSHRDKNRPWSR